MSQTKSAVSSAPQLPPQWQDWIAENLVRGCREPEMIAVMVENSFDPVFASHAIAVIRDMTERVQSGDGKAAAAAMAAGQGPSYVCNPIRIASSSQIDVNGHTVDVGFIGKDPNVALLNNLLSPNECAGLIDRSRGKLKRSEVVNRKTGGFDVDKVRTSEGTHFERGEDELIKGVEARIAAITGIPVENGEPLQILHYGVGGEYLAHHDFFEPKDPGSAVHVKDGGQRIATVVMYLNTVPEGGETSFPEQQLFVKARTGCAVYFEYLNRENQLDSRCLHAGVPVASGEKWIATKWLRERPYVRST